MGSSTLTTAYYYDQYGRVIQTTAQNLMGTDVVSFKYDFAGRLLETKTSGLSMQIWVKNTFDPGNRLKMTCQRISGGATTAPKTEPVGRYRYNELGELVEKWQGCKIQLSSFSTDLQGRLTSINIADPNTLRSQKKHFGLTLSYDLLGNITDQVWGSVPHFRTGATLPAVRQFHYDYDPINRLTAGTFTGGTNENFNLSNLSYDLNGNLSHLTRRVQTPTLGNSPTEDDLNYYYVPNTNRLRNVHDAGSATPNNGKKNHYFWDRNVKNEAGGYNNNTATDDYAYDAAGNLTRDKNRNISTIKYNALGLPEQINIDANRIYYYYTGSGQKLRKDGAYLPTNTPGTTTQVRIDYTLSGVCKNGVFDFLPTAEGRALPPLNGFAPYRYEYQQTDNRSVEPSGKPTHGLPLWGEV